MYVAIFILHSPFTYLLLNNRLERNSTTKDAYIIEVALRLDDRCIGRVLCHELHRVACLVIVEPLERGFVLYQHGSDLPIVHDWLLLDEYDVAIMDTCAYHAVAGGSQAEICINISSSFDITLEVLICKYRFPTGDVAE